MSTLIQIVFDIFLALGLFVVVMRMNRAPKDDPRLSRGLQLLQSKISVLEDLSDRTETQVSQLTAILEQKSREVQAKVQLAEQHVHAIRVSMERSLEVAKIFQDKIPHQEIIERQNTIKYVQAARLAHQGVGVNDIATQVDLPKGEIEFIASVNRDRLMFSEEQLPEWARESALNPGGEAPTAEATGFNGRPTLFQQDSTVAAMSFHDETPPQVSEEERAQRFRAEIELTEQQRLVDNLSRLQTEMQSLDVQLAREGAHRDLTTAFEVPKVETASLQKLGEEFRKACQETERQNSAKPGSSLFPPLEHLTEQLASFIPQAALSAPIVPLTVAAPAVAQVTQTTLDPDALRRAAHEKVQAALRLGASSRLTANTASPAPKELIEAREAAKQLVSDSQSTVQALAQPAAQPRPSNSTHVVNSRGSTNHENVIVKRVIFPKIDSPDV